ncbi:homeobox knotted-1-like 1 isoform X1 [Olea europaea subsp. europaea]|uniref:Homeobox knotted-1-like 1 isoform X1 n=1 Tax=Olea europaea subsp. europaea TaxID=158383 RepID=A0A8S0T176_OLEEU|nr:homeobox knotted-1-like 1 isoform X1 [Olea europaea subsp. europaea]
MDEFNSIIPSISCPNSTGFANHSPVDFDDNQMALIELARETEATRFEMSNNIKAQIANHPLYPNLVSAYIECRKVVLPPEMASLLEEVTKETHSTVSNGADPELDEFMTSYCEVLHRCKEKLSKPFDEAKSFLSNIEFQLSNLCKETFASTTSSSLTSFNYHSADDGDATLDEDVSCEVEATENQESLGTCQGDHELKEMLMRKYSGYLSSLRKDFLRKRRKGKLPKDARMVLVDWWNTHYISFSMYFLYYYLDECGCSVYSIRNKKTLGPSQECENQEIKPPEFLSFCITSIQRKTRKRSYQKLRD